MCRCHGKSSRCAALPQYLVELSPEVIGVVVLMLDFSKAFDRVDHTIALEKLANLGLPDFIVKWMTSFLCRRKERVRIGQYVSDCMEDHQC